MDVTERNGAYLVHAELPGVKKEDIQLSVDGAPVGNGRVGPIARALRAAWPAWVQAEAAADDAADLVEGAPAGGS